MTVEDMIYYFDLIQDKSASPYFDATEKQTFLNRSMHKLARSYSVGELEDDKYGIEAVQTLILEDLPITSSASGLITKSQIDSAINTKTSDGTSCLTILSIAKDAGNGNIYPVNLVKHNDKYKFKNNSFKVASTVYPEYRISRDQLSFDPSGAEDYLVTLIKEPVDIVYDENTPSNNVDCELPEFMHDYVLAIALEDAGVASRDESLMRLHSLSKQNIEMNE